MPLTKPEKTKILFVAFEQLPSFSGTACWCASEISQLGKYFEVDVLSVKSEQLSHVERHFGARLLRVPVGNGPFLTQVKAFQRALNRQLDSEDYRLCHFTSIWEGMVLTSRKKDCGYKLIYQLHSLPSVDFKTTHPEEARQVETSYSFKQQEERCFAASDLLLVGSGLLREHVIRRGVSAKRIEVGLPMLDLKPFEAAAAMPGQPGTILYLGSLLPWQGVVSLLTAISDLPKQPPVRLLLVCPKDEPWLKELLGKVQMLGLGKVVEFLHPSSLEELPTIISQAAICVAPLANHEHNRLAASIPYKILTYQACAKPVVAARQPAMRGLVEQDIHGLLYPPGDAKTLTDCLRTLLQDRERALNMGQAGRRQLEATYSLTSATEQMLGIYRRLIGHPASGESPAEPGLDTQPKLPLGEETPPNLIAPDTPVGQAGPPRPKPASSQDTIPFIREEATPSLFAEALTDKNLASTHVESVREQDLTFHSIEAEAKSDNEDDPDQWQVQELSQIQLPLNLPQALYSDIGEREPTIVVAEKQEERTSTGELEMVPDSEVQLIEGVDAAAMAAKKQDAKKPDSK